MPVRVRDIAVGRKHAVVADLDRRRRRDPDTRQQNAVVADADAARLCLIREHGQADGSLTRGHAVHARTDTDAWAIDVKAPGIDEGTTFPYRVQLRVHVALRVDLTGVGEGSLDEQRAMIASHAAGSSFVPSKGKGGRSAFPEAHVPVGRVAKSHTTV